MCKKKIVENLFIGLGHKVKTKVHKISKTEPIRGLVKLKVGYMNMEYQGGVLL